MGTVREAALRLRLIDQFTGPGKGVVKTMSAIDRTLQTFGKGKAPEIQNLVQQLESLKGKAGAIKAFTESRRGLKELSQEFKLAGSNASRLEAAFKTATKPTAQMKRDLENARSALQQTRKAFMEQGQAVRSAERALQTFGIAGREAISRSQQAIRNQIAQTIREMRRLDRESRRPAMRPPSNPRPPASRTSALGTPTTNRPVRIGGGSIFGDVVAMEVGGRVSEGSANMVVGAAQREAMLNRIRNVSGSEEEVSEAARISAKASAAYPLSSQADSLGDYVELRSLAVSSDPGKPIDIDKMDRNVLLMAQARAALASSGYALGDTEAKALAQAIEGTGRTMDPDAQRKMLDAFVRAKQVFGNAIDATSIRDFVMNAKAQNFSASDESFFYTTLARLAQGNPSRLGNEFAQTMNTLVGGHMTKAGANWLADIGLIDREQIRNGEGGKFYIEGGIKEQDLLSSDQTAWAQEVLLPGLKNSGVLNEEAVHRRSGLLASQSPGTDPQVIEERAIHGLIADALMKSGFRTTVTDNLIHAIANEFQTNKDIAQMKTASGLAAADTVGRNPVASFNELISSIGNFGAVLSSPAMKDAAATMHGLAGGIAEMTTTLQQWQKDHPKAAETVGAAVPAAAAAGGAWLTYKGFSRIIGRVSPPGRSGGPLGLLGKYGKLGLKGIGRFAGPAGWAFTGYEAAKALGDYAETPEGKAAIAQQNADDRRRMELQGRIEQINGEAQGAMSLGDLDALARYNAEIADINRQLNEIGQVQIRPQVDSSSIDEALGKANALRSALGGAGGSIGIPPTNNSFGGPRASGGPVQTGKTYLVGEKGPEPFIPRRSGTILPNSALGGVSMVNHFHLHGKATEEDAMTILSQLNRLVRRSSQTMYGGTR